MKARPLPLFEVKNRHPEGKKQHGRVAGLLVAYRPIVQRAAGTACLQRVRDEREKAGRARKNTV